MSTPITVCCLGAETPLSQVVRIRAGFTQLPDVVVTQDLAQADLIYMNNGPYTGVTRSLVKPGAKLLFNVLDVPSHLLPPAGDFTFAKLQEWNTELRRADAVTAISQFTQGQV